MRHLVFAFSIFVSAGCAVVPAPKPTGPNAIMLRTMYWGEQTSAWTVTDRGEATYVDRERSVTFAIETRTFARIQEIFRPYEGRDFECNREVADGPYGMVIWSSQQGYEYHRVQWDAGCLGGDADDLFMRLDAAMEVLAPLRDATSASP